MVPAGTNMAPDTASPQQGAEAEARLLRKGARSPREAEPELPGAAQGTCTQACLQIDRESTAPKKCTNSRILLPEAGHTQLTLLSLTQQLSSRS